MQSLQTECLTMGNLSQQKERFTANSDRWVGGGVKSQGKRTSSRII